MPQSAPQSLQFFLGISGQQTGPFSESDVIKKIKRGDVPPDALVWYDGLPDWQAIGEIDYFKDALGGGGGKSPSRTVAGGFKPLNDDDSVEEEDKPVVNAVFNRPKKGRSSDSTASFASSGGGAEPIFGDEVSFGGGGGGSSKLLPKLIGVIVLGAAAGAGYYYYSQGGPVDPFAVARPSVKQSAPVAEATSREGRLRKATSELLLHPETSVNLLLALVKETHEDKVGAEALSTMVEYYRQRQRHQEAGQLLMEANQPAEAAKLFLMEPPAYNDADKALFAAYERSQDASRRELLVKDIEILLGALSNFSVAEERIRRLEKDFPQQKHPYGYYLKSLDQKIGDLFQRTSFFFVQNLLAFISTELPELSLISRPVVSIQKDKKGMYRIVGTYKGEVSLNQDRLKGIQFTFWHYNEAWTVVETNLTLERQRFSADVRKKHVAELYTPEKMLEYMQITFRNVFPKHLYHEKVTPAQQASATKSNNY